MLKSARCVERSSTGTAKPEVMEEEEREARPEFPAFKYKGLDQET